MSFRWQSYEFQFPFLWEKDEAKNFAGLHDVSIRIDPPLWGKDLEFYYMWGRVDLYHSKFPEVHYAMPVGIYSPEDFARIYNTLQRNNQELFHHMNNFYISHGRVTSVLYPTITPFTEDGGEIYMLDDIVPKQIPEPFCLRSNSLEHLNSEVDVSSNSSSFGFEKGLLFPNNGFSLLSSVSSGLDIENQDSVVNGILKGCGLDELKGLEGLDPFDCSESSEEHADCKLCTNLFNIYT